MSFAADVRAQMPDGLHLPEAFAVTFDWLEAQGWRHAFNRRGPDDVPRHYLSIYPPKQMNAPGASHVIFCFEGGPPLHEPGPEAMARFVSLGIIAGDGGTLSLWLDDAGKQWVVVFNHGIPFVLGDDPVVALQFLAMGYPEPAALSDPNLSASEYAVREGYDPPLKPEGLRAFLTERFGVTVPACAADLGIKIPSSDDPDPCREWLQQAVPAPDAREIPGMTADNPYVITADLRKALGDEGVAALRTAYDFVIEEE